MNGNMDPLFIEAGINPDKILNAAVRAANAAGEILMEGLDKTIKIDYKGKIDIVTEIDLSSQKCILNILKTEFPDHVMIAEEQENQSYSEERFVWLIDPLDGTTNYAHGYRCFAVSIAFLINNVPCVGVVYDPWGDELFSAILGRGAFVNNSPIRVTLESDLDRSLLVTGFPYDVRDAQINNLGLFNHFVVRAQAVRRDGSAALDLAYTAAGRFDGFWELKLHPWDLAAGALLVQEAGGKVSTFTGEKFHPEVFDLLATNGKIHERMVKEMSAVPREKW